MELGLGERWGWGWERGRVHVRQGSFLEVPEGLGAVQGA